jgi:hypothetical protein
MASTEVYIASISIYLISIAILICTTLLIYRKYKDNNFLSGMVLTGILNLLPLLSLITLYFYWVTYILSLIFGFAAGYFNTNIKLGTLSGATGILLSWILFGLLSPLGFLLFYSFFYGCLVIIPTIIIGAVSGAIGSKIRQKKETTKTTKVAV